MAYTINEIIGAFKNLNDYEVLTVIWTDNNTSYVHRVSKNALLKVKTKRTSETGGLSHDLYWESKKSGIVKIPLEMIIDILIEFKLNASDWD